MARQLVSIRQLLLLLTDKIDQAGCFPKDFHLIVHRIKENAAGENWEVSMDTCINGEEGSCCAFFPSLVSGMSLRFNLRD
jgi:hypothetical protein